MLFQLIDLLWWPRCLFSTNLDSWITPYCEYNPLHISINYSICYFLSLSTNNEQNHSLDFDISLTSNGPPTQNRKRIRFSRETNRQIIRRQRREEGRLNLSSKHVKICRFGDIETVPHLFISTKLKTALHVPSFKALSLSLSSFE